MDRVPFEAVPGFIEIVGEAGVEQAEIEKCFALNDD